MLTVAHSLVILYNLTALARAYTTFQPNCSAPSTSVNFVSSNETRGTIDILWSCLFTIIACTWTVQHLNVPEQREDRDKGWLGDIKWALKRTFHTAKWMLVTALAPEILITKSLGDRFPTNDEFERLSQLAAEDEVPWSTTHSLFANMGGFVIRWNVPERVGKLKEAKVDPTFPALAGSQEVISNGQEPEVAEQSRSDGPQPQTESKEIESTEVETYPETHSSQYSNPYHLRARDLIILREAGFLPRLPFITEAELCDKGKSDNLVRVLTVIQLLWMVSQIIVRATRQLAISQLEIAVMAFAVCAVVIYVLNWEKPKDVQTPYTLLQYRRSIPKTVLLALVRAKEVDRGLVLEVIFELFVALLKCGYQTTHLLPGSPIPNHLAAYPKIGSELKCFWVQSAGLILGGVIFGAVHTAAWDFVFPTLVERTLWRVASVLCTAAPFLSILALFVITYIQNAAANTSINGIFFLILAFLSPLLEVVYIVGRLFLLVEIFRTLCFLPPSAYVATWAANVPHIG